MSVYTINIFMEWRKNNECYFFGYEVYENENPYPVAQSKAEYPRVFSAVVAATVAIVATATMVQKPQFTPRDKHVYKFTVDGYLLTKLTPQFSENLTKKLEGKPTKLFSEESYEELMQRLMQELMEQFMEQLLQLFLAELMQQKQELLRLFLVKLTKLFAQELTKKLNDELT